MQDKQHIVHRAQRGDKEALAQLYEAYFDNIYRYATLRTGNRIEAEDITQEIFLKMVGSIGTFKWKGIPFSAWLFRIAHNEVVDYWRRKNKQRTVSFNESNELLAKATSSAGNPHPEVEFKLDIEQIRAATQRLTQAQQEVISLRFSAELSIAQVLQFIRKSTDFERGFWWYKIFGTTNQSLPC